MALTEWGINNDYAKLKHVLLGKPEYYRWVEAGPLIGRTLANADKTGHKFDLQVAMAQHAEMVSIYEENDVTCHYLDSDEALHRNFFARDSSAMTPWGALICHMQLIVLLSPLSLKTTMEPFLQLPHQKCHLGQSTLQ